jgi:hypothetical protein
MMMYVVLNCRYEPLYVKAFKLTNVDENTRDSIRIPAGSPAMKKRTTLNDVAGDEQTVPFSDCVLPIYASCGT